MSSKIATAACYLPLKAPKPVTVLFPGVSYDIRNYPCKDLEPSENQVRNRGMCAASEV
jgi:hypothetical protein